LQWSLQSINGTPSLVLNNPTPFHYTFQRLEISADGQSIRIERPAMAAPFGREIYPLADFKPGTDTQLLFTTINDYGGITDATTLPVRQHP
jgi:chaperone protein EcpD